MLDVIKLFQEREARDELGLGTIRDAFADYFFPGTSTVQTRVRYMLFVPWIYLELEEKKISPVEIIDKARRYEIKLITALIEGGEIEGVIGSRARHHLKRLPSNIYWAGLGSWGIRRSPDSQEAYHRSLSYFYRLKKLVVGEETLAAVQANWDPGLPEPPINFLDQTTFTLRQKDAQYLYDRISLQHRGTLLASLLNQPAFVSSDFAWGHPVVPHLKPSLKQVLAHAQNFSETVWGAALLYNLFLARARDNEAWVVDFEQELEYWAELIDNRRAVLTHWYQKLDDFWINEALQLARVPKLTRQFVDTWFHYLFATPSLATLKDNPQVQRLIERRELGLKQNRARLTNPRALELWQGRSGDRQLDFRWSSAQIFAADILNGLHPVEPSL